MTDTFTAACVQNCASIDPTETTARAEDLTREAAARGADFSGADLADSDLLMARLTGANLSGANLSGADLEAVDLRSTSLRDARLDGARLKDADFGDSDWWRARGLTTEDLERLKREFAPGEDAGADQRDDYADWLRGAGG